MCIRDRVEQCVAFYEEHFPDRYFLELIRTGRQDEEAYLHAAVALAEARGLPVVATNDVRFLDTSDFDEMCIRDRDKMDLQEPQSIDDVLVIDAEARAIAHQQLQRLVAQA